MQSKRAFPEQKEGKASMNEFDFKIEISFAGTEIFFYNGNERAINEKNFEKRKGGNKP